MGERSSAEREARRRDREHEVGGRVAHRLHLNRRRFSHPLCQLSKRSRGSDVSAAPHPHFPAPSNCPRFLTTFTPQKRSSMDTARFGNRNRSPDPSLFVRPAMAGGQGGDLPASAPGSLSSSPVRTGGISLSSRTAESRRLVEGRRRTWVVESTEARSPSEHSPLSDWGPATDARSDTDCESESPSPQRGWLEQTGWDTISAWDKLVAFPGRGPSPLSARNGEQSSPFSFNIALQL